MRSLSYVFREAPDAPMDATTFFGLFRDQNASVWMQSKAQFFWVFHRGEVGNVRAFKILGRYEEKVGEFVVYETKQLRLNTGMIAEYSLEHGLYSEEGDSTYLHYMLLSRPAQDQHAQKPPLLHMWRCKTYPAEIAQLIERQAFDSEHRRDEAHWARRGASEESWDGWVWAYGDGRYWTEERGTFTLIPRHNRPDTDGGHCGGPKEKRE